MLKNDYGNISGNTACERLELENNLARTIRIKGNIVTRVNVTYNILQFYATGMF